MKPPVASTGKGKIIPLNRKHKSDSIQRTTRKRLPDSTQGVLSTTEAVIEMKEKRVAYLKDEEA